MIAGNQTDVARKLFAKYENEINDKYPLYTKLKTRETSDKAVKTYEEMLAKGGDIEGNIQKIRPVELMLKVLSMYLS